LVIVGEDDGVFFALELLEFREEIGRAWRGHGRNWILWKAGMMQCFIFWTWALQVGLDLN
jgi:hypothetical protein